MAVEIKHSIKSDIKEFFFILNCSYITLTSLTSLLQENKVITAAAFTFCFINSLISLLFYRLRLMRYQRSEELK